MTAKLPAQAFSGIEYVRRYYGVPAKRGGRVVYTGLDGNPYPGTITSADGQYLRVRLDGDPIRYTVHPDDLAYLTPETES